MPYKDKAKKLASQRKHYRNHRKQVIEAVAYRKHTMYAGECRNCGGPTVGQTKQHRPEWCSKTECRKAMWKAKTPNPGETTDA